MLFGQSSRSAAATGSFDFRVSEGSLSVAVADTAAPIPILFYPTVVIVSPPSTGALLPPRGKPWVAATFSDAAIEATNRNFPSFIAQAESLNPALGVSEVAWGATAATPTGRDISTGRAANRYTVTVDLEQALRKATGPRQLPLRLTIDSEISVLRASSTSGPTTMTEHVWVDDTGRLAGVEISPPVPGVGTGRVTFSDFSSAVALDPPAASKVVAIGSLSPTGERENRNGGDADGA
jgi:hypothetical protein